MRSIFTDVIRKHDRETYGGRSEMGHIDENIREILGKARVKMCEEDWYIDLILEQVWDDLPEKVKRPSNIPDIRRLIVERINETREDFMKEVGLIEDEKDEEEIIEYIINIDITDDVSGTVYKVQGGGPGYRDVVEDLERAAGSVFFYEYRDNNPNGGINAFKVDIKIYKNGEVVSELESTDALCMGVVDVLRSARYAMAVEHSGNRVQKIS